MKYGWKRDEIDHRDYMYIARREPIYLPEKVDLRENDTVNIKIYDQGNLGSCTAQASAGAIQYVRSLDYIPSRLFIYYNTRVIERTVTCDNGASIRNTVKSINKKGYCNEEKWPYKIEMFADKPNDECYEEGRNNLIQQYRKVRQTLTQLKLALHNNSPIIFGFEVFSYFESDEMAKEGILKMPSRRDRLLGGHAVLAVGYDNDEEMFLIKNSWGTNWGLDGYFKMPFNYILNHNLASDFWVVDS